MSLLNPDSSARQIDGMFGKNPLRLPDAGMITDHRMGGAKVPSGSARHAGCFP